MKLSERTRRDSCGHTVVRRLSSTSPVPNAEPSVARVPGGLAGPDSPEKLVESSAAHLEHLPDSCPGFLPGHAVIALRLKHPVLAPRRVTAKWPE